MSKPPRFTSPSAGSHIRSVYCCTLQSRFQGWPVKWQQSFYRPVSVIQNKTGYCCPPSENMINVFRKQFSSFIMIQAVVFFCIIKNKRRTCCPTRHLMPYRIVLHVSFYTYHRQAFIFRTIKKKTWVHFSICKYSNV